MTQPLMWEWGFRMGTRSLNGTGSAFSALSPTSAEVTSGLSSLASSAQMVSSLLCPGSWNRQWPHICGLYFSRASSFLTQVSFGRNCTCKYSLGPKLSGATQLSVFSSISGETDAGYGAEFTLPVEQPVKRAHLLCVVPEGEPWLVDGSSQNKGIISIQKRNFIAQPSKKGNTEQSVCGT